MDAVAGVKKTEEKQAAPNSMLKTMMDTLVVTVEPHLTRLAAPPRVMDAWKNFCQSLEDWLSGRL